MPIGPGANGVALMNAENAQWEIKHAQQIVDRQNAEAKAKAEAAEKQLEANHQARIREKEQQMSIAEQKAQEILAQHPPIFKKGDIVKLKMSEKTKKTFDNSPPKLPWDGTKNDPRWWWVVKSWDGAIGIVSSDNVVFKDPMNPNIDEYTYKVKVQRVSGGSNYNPTPSSNQLEYLKLPVDENILQRDMTSIVYTPEQKEADVKIFENYWLKLRDVRTKITPIDLEKSIETSGGKRRSKSNNKKPKKTAKRSKRSKRAKSRRTRRQCK